MSFVLTNVRLFTGGADLTGMNNQLSLSSECEEKDKTTYGSEGWKEVKGGLFATDIEGAGFWEAGDASKVDNSSWGLLGTTGPWSACPDAAAVAGLCYFTNALETKFKLGDQVGELAPWEAAAKGTWPMVRGVVAHPPGTARTTTGSGTAQQLGAVVAGKQLYAALHVLSVAGTDTPTITVAIQSDNASNFPSATTQITFAAATAVGGQILRVPGAITDDWFRPTWTISGTNPSFLFVVAFGIA